MEMGDDRYMTTPAQQTSAAGKHVKQLSIAFGINLGLLVAGILGGLLAGSLAVLAEAGHMMVDSVAIGLSLAAIYFARRSPTPKRSFGYYRLEILAAVINGVLLLGVGIVVLVGAVLRLMNPPTVASGLMLVFGVVALIGNGIAAWLLTRGQSESLTTRAVFLDFLTDALGALTVIVAAIVIATTGFEQADAIGSIIIALLILPRTWKLLGTTVNVLLEATPEGVDLGEVRRHILETDGVTGCHDLHALDDHQRHERAVGPRRVEGGRGRAAGARPAGRMSGRSFRHRALDLPARTGDASGTRADDPSLERRFGVSTTQGGRSREGRSQRFTPPS